MIESLLKKLPWTPGRIGTGYNKLCLLQSRLFKCDAYLLYFPTGSEITPHTDEVEEGRHFRLNIMLRKAEQGGEFKCDCPTYVGYRLFYFRPDLFEHSVTKIEEGYRLMLSVGWVRK